MRLISRLFAWLDGGSSHYCYGCWYRFRMKLDCYCPAKHMLDCTGCYACHHINPLTHAEAIRLVEKGLP